MSGRPVQVVVVAYGAPQLVAGCLDGLGEDFPVTVVDNSSSPEVREAVDRPGVRYVDPGRNGGFGAGVNVALLELLTGEPCDVLLLNPDARIGAEAVHRLTEALRAGRAGAVSPALTDDDGEPQRVLWPFPSPGRMWREALSPGRYEGPGEFAVGAVLLLRWEALLTVGLFDERYFLYAEETDWQRRAAACGWVAAEVPEVTAQHTGAATSADPRRREQLFHAGTETYVRIWFGSRGWRSYRAAAITGALLRGFLPPRTRAAEARRRLRLYVRGPRRAAGLGKLA